MSRILLTGRDGQVGHALLRALAPLGEVVALGREELDLADAGRLRERVRALAPRLIVNAAAYTAVDRAEAEPEAALAVNGTAPGILAEEARRLDALLVHYSTDYVFDGAQEAPYAEDDAPSPLNAYGRSKLAGEQAIAAAGPRHLILRTSWVYGARGRNFLLTMLRLAREGRPLRVVCDQFGAPTSSGELARATAAILGQLAARPGAGGLYHLTAAGRTSWHGFAVEILRRAGLPQVAVQPIPSADYPTPAARPRNSVLSCERAARDFGVRLRPWQDGLDAVLAELAAAERPAA